MIDRGHDLSITRQAKVLKISRGSIYYLPRPVSAADLVVMQRLDRLHLEYPFAGSRMLRVNRRSNLTPYRRPILTPLNGGL
jgi:putative transposase